ncbi:radical SAM/CxCxxxxC motif protein YfkAB [Cytobacillus sp. IB215316]|uniref:radical SAM/CxCxxxxC motif protein YfkAB n=1 Tax=Cytobacillus sp. IB215316 TaxID=3097354 RepID=UPI002A11E367|nr:radical SAM/CxCxxxxC motif protein YfkAB [Cytobacillus sp. IB215316]MDX8361551.1 radical SAM/CxCxxxxC motif protein YfkAB [Cytobacillus sp. IB215316]
MSTTKQKKLISPLNDPWEAYTDVEELGQLELTNIEFTTTTLCNMRCEHCAVGYTLQSKDPHPLPLNLLLTRLDEIPHLRSVSITGGEPMLSSSSVNGYVKPLLKYAHDRGVRTQLNSNLTVHLSKYEQIMPYLDVLHISHNWGTVEEFAEGGFAMMERKPTFKQREKYFNQIIENSRTLSKEGVMISAETMLNKRTLPYIEQIHHQVINDMLCARHEIHPMYPSDFASHLEVLSLDELRAAIHHLLDVRDENTWMLFGTLPFYPCSDKDEDLTLLRRLYESRNISVRNDPDGRSRLNVNIFTGEVIVTDFGDAPPLGNIQSNSLLESYQLWTRSPLAKMLSCHCPAVKCLGPNLLVKDRYYKDTDFLTKETKLVRSEA